MTKHLTPVIEKVLAGEMSVGEAGRSAGVSAMTISRALQAHPDYARAKAEGRVAARPAQNDVDVEALKNHPAVLEVVTKGLGYREAGEKHGVAVMTLNRWVKRAYPDYDGVRHRGRPPKKKEEAPSRVLHDDPGFVQLREALAQFAAAKGVGARDVAVALLAET